MNQRRQFLTAILCAASAGVGLSTPTAQGQSKKPLRSRDLARKFNEAYQQKDWPRAIGFAEQWASLVPTDAVAAYNLTCAYALSGDTLLAVEWLNKSVDRGFIDTAHMRADTDLDSIRNDPGYINILRTANEAYERSLAPARASKPLVYVPPDLDTRQPAPLIIALHGYGSNADDISGPWREVARQNGAILAAPRAVRFVPQSSGYSWNNAAEADIIVTNAVEFCKSHHNVDVSRIVLTGFSQGGAMTFALAAKHPDMFCGVIPMAGRVIPPPGASTPAHEFAPPSSQGRPRYFLAVGENDRAAVVEGNRRAAASFTERGFETRLVIYPNLGHRFPPNTTDALSKALHFALGVE